MITAVKKLLCVLISLLFVFIVPARDVVKISEEIGESVCGTQPEYEAYEYEIKQDFSTVSTASSVVTALAATITSDSNISERLLSAKNLAVPSVVLGSTGNANTIYIEETSSVDFQKSPAIIGEPIDISGGGSFTSATLKFTLKESKPSAVICKYSEGSTSVLTSSYNSSDKTVSATISGVGTYFVLDVQTLLDSFKRPAVDIVIVLDNTGVTAEEFNSAKEKIELLKTSLEEERIDVNLIMLEHFEQKVIHQQTVTLKVFGSDNETTENTDNNGAQQYVSPQEITVDFNQYTNLCTKQFREDVQRIYLVFSQNTIHTVFEDSSALTGGQVFAADFGEIESYKKQIRNLILGEEAVIYLNGPIPVPVKLNEFPQEGSKTDTDGDGLADIEELTSVSPSGKYNLDALAKAVNPDAVSGVYGYVPLYKYTSNPTLTDTDYDGINDKSDATPKNNSNVGIMHYPIEKKPYTCNIEFNVDYRDLLEEYNTLYSKDLSVLSILLASDIYEDLYVEVTNGAVKGGSDSVLDFGAMLGLENTKHIGVTSDEYSVDKDDVTDFFVGHKKIMYNGELREVIVVSVRGTNATNEEWSSNFDVGADTSEYYSATGKSHPHWLNKENHKGFDVTSNRVLEKLLAYIEENIDASAQKSILITGHSRGAALANILGTYFEDSNEYTSYTYTFAAPNTTTSKKASKYKTIFNIKNGDDLIPFLPIGNWGFVNYGTTKSISIMDNYESGFLASDEGSFEWFIGEDYNNDGGTQRTLDCFAAIVTCREELYVIDTSSDGTAYENGLGHISLEGAQKELNELTATFESESLMRFCRFTIEKGLFIYKVKINYSPAYLMQSLANMTTSTGPLLGHAISGKYATAKNSFIASSGKVLVGGMVHPHMQPTYYLIAHNNFLPLK